MHTPHRHLIAASFQIMKNLELLRKTTDFNSFTARLREKCLTHGKVKVRMRNALWVEVIFQPEIPDDASGGFRTEDHGRIWEPNGRSITSSDFDLIEFED